MIKGPRILLLDIETAPIEAQVWSIWDQNIGLNQITKDWAIIAWAAKWLDEPASKMIYMDQRKARNIRYEKPILKQLWKLLDEADIIITQNGRAFDEKKINARFIHFGFKPPSSFRHLDTKVISKKFGFTSHRLEYLCEVLKTPHKKLKHKKFPGHELWTECLKRNPEAWKEMELYNKHDVLVLEEVYKKLQPWMRGVTIDPEQAEKVCNCGSENIVKNGFCYSSRGKYQRYSCDDCGAEIKSSINVLAKRNRKEQKHV